jgi:trehalose-6-phosphate synthase
VEGLLGADLIGFQRGDDAANFLRACRRLTRSTTHGSVIETPNWGQQSGTGRRLRAAAFPISIDAAALEGLARRQEVQARARELRRELGDPKVVLLGVDRLDYTKGIVHRLRAYGELLDAGELDPSSAILVQVASPSRERVEEYQHLRDEVEGIVGRINGDHSSVGRTAIHYLHQSFPKEEMAALYLAADVMLVTPLRDGMNLVAKEYVACHFDLSGALVLSEFTGAADELRQAFLCNPYDIEGVKATILQASRVSSSEAARRMRALRRRVTDYDVHHWASTFLAALDMVTGDERP